MELIDFNEYYDNSGLPLQGAELKIVKVCVLMRRVIKDAQDALIRRSNYKPLSMSMGGIVKPNSGGITIV